MALGAGAEIHVAFRYIWLGQKCENVQAYICQGAAFVTATMIQTLEALWNDYEARLRALTPDDAAMATWVSLLGTQIGGALEFAEFAVPLDEQVGTRDATDRVPVSGTLAMGFRETVATRVTRPGQKRFPFLFTTDVSGNTLGGGVLALLDPVAVAFTSPSALGSPVIGGVLQPVIVHEPGVRDPTRQIQDVLGYVLNPNSTSQVSRKAGHGS